jgi:hypothetical protein
MSVVICWHGREVTSRPNPKIPGGKSYELVHANDETPCTGTRK